MIREFECTGDAYDASQCDDEITMHTVMVIASEGVVGLLCDAWPVAVTQQCGHFHTVAEGRVPHELASVDNRNGAAMPEEACRAAVAEAVRLGFPLAAEWERYA